MNGWSGCTATTEARRPRWAMLAWAGAGGPWRDARRGTIFATVGGKEGEVTS
jgi:hypothetical protein